MASNGRVWDGVALQWHDMATSGSVSSPSLDYDVVGMRTAGLVKLTQWRDDKVHTGVSNIGNVTVQPRGMDSTWAWDGPGSIVVMRIPFHLLQQAVDAPVKGGRRSTELVNCFGLHDPFIERIAWHFVDELRSPAHPAQAYIAQALSYTLALHMVHRFDYLSVLRSEPVHRLSVRALARVHAFIEEHLHGPIDLQALADVANVSRFHFARLFRGSMGMSAMAYIEQKRMRRARDLIRSRHLNVAQVALAVGYEDQSYFSRRFRLVVGVAPSAFARLNGTQKAT